MRAKIRCPPEWIVGAVCLALSLWPDIRVATAMEQVRFESARYLTGSLQRRLARERGIVIERPAPQMIDAYLAKPGGDGPFPAAVVLHGCGGLSERFRDYWAEQLVGWNYAVLVVDSFTARGVGDSCAEVELYRVGDAWGALAFLSQQRFVDPKRVALLGVSAGGIAALSVAEKRDARVFDQNRSLAFKAAIAFYPACLSGGNFGIPILILIGEMDDWSPAAACRRMLASRPDRATPVRLVVYPDAQHGFAEPWLVPGQRSFGHWLEYNPAAAVSALAEVRRFLADNVAR